MKIRLFIDSPRFRSSAREGAKDDSIALLGEVYYLPLFQQNMECVCDESDPTIISQSINLLSVTWMWRGAGPHNLSVAAVQRPWTPEGGLGENTHEADNYRNAPLAMWRVKNSFMSYYTV